MCCVISVNSNKTLPDRNVEYELICDRRGIVEQIYLRSLVEHCGEYVLGTVKKSRENPDIPVGVKYTFIYT